MCSNSWPLLLDLSRDECKRILRRLELDAYSSIISAFRAQGDLTKDKKKLLNDLQASMSISTERHRAEVRRATNDEKLTTIADSICGPDVSSEWQIEGRRLVPLMPRLVPQTAFTLTANNAANIQAEKNASLPIPALTGNKELAASTGNISTPTAGSNKNARPTSPGSNVIVLPSGVHVHIKGGLNTEEEDIHAKVKRRRSSSICESIVVSKAAQMGTPAQTAKVISATSHTPAAMGMSSNTAPSPMKISFSKSPGKAHTTITPSQQKVILVSGSGHTSSGQTILQRSMAVPVMRSGTTTYSSGGGVPVTPTHTGKTSIVVPSSLSLQAAMTSPTTANGNLGNIVTVATSTTASTVSTVGGPAILASSLNQAKTRPKTIAARPKGPGQRSGIVIPVGSSPVHPSPSNIHQNIQIKPVSKPTIHIKQEGGMKIITQGVPSTTSKILPKPTLSAAGGASPVVVMTTSSVSSIAGKSGITTVSGGRVVNLTGSTKITTASRSGQANVVTVNPKTLQLTAIKGSTGTTVLSGGRVATATGAKPNVIVVQKAQPKRGAGTPGTPTSISVVTRGPGGMQSPFEKELVSFIQKQDSLKTQVQKGPGGRPVLPKGLDPKKPIMLRQRSGESSSLLAELIQAAGMQQQQQSESEQAAHTLLTTGGDGDGHMTMLMKEEEVSTSLAPSTSEVISQPLLQQETISIKTDEGGNQWVEYDTPGASGDSSTQSAVKALLHLQSKGKLREVVTRPSSLQLQHSTQPVQEQQIIIEDAGGVIQQEQIEPSSTQPGETTRTTVVQLQSGDIAQEILGELDPQTGILYNSDGTQIQLPPGTELKTVTTPGGQVLGVSGVEGEKVITVTDASGKEVTGKPVDFLSSALSQAQIDLDPYQFIEEDEPSSFSKVSQAAGGSTVSVITSSVVTAVPQRPSVEGTTNMMSILNTSATTGITTSVTEEASDAPKITLREVEEGSEEQTIQVVDEPSGEESSLPEMILEKQPAEETDELQTPTSTAETVLVDVVQPITQTLAVPTPDSSVAVTMEPSMSPMKLEDYTSQRLVEPGGTEAEGTALLGSPTGGSGSDSQGDGPGTPVRLSKRKRKAAPLPDDLPTMSSAPNNWTKMALQLIMKVSKFRGAYKEKGQMSAAAWFTQPVDQNEVPDYYEIIHNPMDFSTIRKKLETGQYADWEDFHSDMLLVRDNCHLYNPPGHEVRRDCDEVFAFYHMEYEKTLERWQKSPVGSPTGKKIRLDRSPIRP